MMAISAALLFTGISSDRQLPAQWQRQINPKTTHQALSRNGGRFFVEANWDG